MKIKLPDDIISPEDLKEAVLGVRQYAKWYNQAARKQQVGGVNAGEPPVIASAAVGLIRDLDSGQAIKPESLDELIASLETFQDSAPHITLTLAGPAPGELRKTLVAWCRQNISPDILVEFRFNATLLGGMVVRYGSHVYDWSFRRQILAARPKFPETLRNV